MHTAAILRAHGLGELADRAELLVTELATNSVRHTEGPASVRVQWLSVLRVSVCDSAALPPGPGNRRAPTGPYVGGGRGLLILDVLADRWGGYAMGVGPEGGEGGKTIWFELGRGGPESGTSAFVA